MRLWGAWWNPGRSARPVGAEAAALLKRKDLADSLVTLGLQILHEQPAGPMRLWEFALRLEDRLDMPPTPLGELCDAIKSALHRIDDSRLKLLATGMQGVGYVYDAENPESCPVRSGH